MRELLRPTNEYAPGVIMPGDPGIALALAQQLLEAPLMANHHRGLWGYTGERADGGGPLSIQSSGYGAAGARAVVHQLAALGVREVVRVGTAVALDPGLTAGELVDVASGLDPSGERAQASAELRERIAAGAPDARTTTDRLRGGLVASADSIAEALELGRQAGALAADVASAGVLRQAAVCGVEAACILVVDRAGEARLTDPDIETALVSVGRIVQDLG